MAHMQTSTAIESGPPRPPVEVPSEPIAEISATLLRAQAFLSGCAIALLVREGAWLVCRASNGAAAPETGSRMTVENTFLGLCVTLKKPQSCEDADTDLRVENATSSRLRAKSILAVPVRAGQDVIAVLAGFSAAPNAFTNTQVAILRTVADSLSRPVQQLPASPPPPEPPAPRTEPAPASPREAAPEKVAKPEPQPVPPVVAAAPVLPSPAPKEEVLTLADEVAAPPRPLELRPPEPRPLPRPTPLAARTTIYPVPKSLEFARTQPRGFSPALFRITAITAVCLLCAFASVGWYSRRTPAAPHVSAAPAAPVVSPATPSAPSPSAPKLETAAVPFQPASETQKVRATLSTSEEPKPAPEKEAPHKELVAEPPVRELSSPKLAAAAAPVEAPALALSTPSALPALVAPHAAAPQLRHSDEVPARLEYRVSPQYPVMALKRHISGQVVLSLRVRKDGSVSDVKMLSGNLFFRDSAIDAVRKWHYAPATLDGRPVEATAQAVLKFDLPGEKR